MNEATRRALLAEVEDARERLHDKLSEADIPGGERDDLEKVYGALCSVSRVLSDNEETPAAEPPFAVFGPKDLQAVTVHAGDKIRCQHCGEAHALSASRNSRGELSELLLAYTCPKMGQTYIAALDNKLLRSLSRLP